MRAGAVAVAGLLLAACASATPPPPSGLPKTPRELKVEVPPEWRPGDRWVYRWSSAAQSGARTVEVVEVRSMGGARYYVARSDDVHEYWTPELHWAALVRDAKVEARMLPPEPWFVWPLEQGRRWTHHATYEDGKGKSEVSDRFSVVTTEVVEVPAGRFNAVKVVRQTDRRDLDEYWYAPEVRFYVKWVGRRGDAQFEEQLREYRQAPRLDSGRRGRARPTPEATNGAIADYGSLGSRVRQHSGDLRRGTFRTPDAVTPRRAPACRGRSGTACSIAGCPPRTRVPAVARGA